MEILNVADGPGIAFFRSTLGNGDSSV